jgi:renalase
MTATNKNIIILGAGIAGLACATELHKMGCSLKVLEKSMGLGGRMATRRVQNTWVDHGTQYFTAQQTQFRQFVRQLVDLEIAQPWVTDIYSLQRGKLVPPSLDDRQTRYICSQGMTSIAKYLARPLQEEKLISTNVRINAAVATGNRWQLRSDQGEIFSAHIVVSTIPAPQFLPIFSKPLAVNQAFIDTIATVQFTPSLAVMAGYDPDQFVPESWYAVRCVDDPILSWVCLNSAKAGATDSSVFVIHSSIKYAHQSLDESNLELAGKPILSQMGKHFEKWLETPLWWQVHRWRYAIVEEPLPVPYLLTTKPLPLICAGDWCGGFGLESAYMSGIATAQAVLELLS